MRQIKVELPKRTDKPSMKDIKEMREWVKEMIMSDSDWSQYKNKRYMFTKIPIYCEQCRERMEPRNRYQVKYGFCDIHCGNRLYGLTY